ncbi:MAG TPA: DinB family protein [Mycobacteriales bacterium]
MAGDDGGMVWTAPVVERVDEPFVADERGMLEGFLDFARSTLLVKCAGLTGPQLADRALPPSTLSLLGLVRHVTDVERTWFRQRFGGEPVPSVHTRPEAAFEEAVAEGAEADLDRLVAEWQASRRAVAGLPLDHVFVSERWGPMQLRWALCHLTSEYDRHNGHADLLRERIDGRTGT